MSLRAELTNRLRYLARRARFDKELDQEIQFHIGTRVAELEQAGLARSDALAQARREFGSTVRIREETRETWQFRWLEDLVQDMPTEVSGRLANRKKMTTR